MPDRYPMSALKPGDLLLFHSDSESPVSALIATLTGYPVSHSAVVYKTKKNTVPRMLESGFDGVEESDVNHYNPRIAYVRRLHEADHLDFTPLVSVAETYIGRPYGFLNLVFIGLTIILTKRIPCASSPVVQTVLKAATYAVQTYIKEKIKPGSGNSLVCSEFVYHAFADTALQTGNDTYRIKLSNAKKNGIDKKSMFSRMCSAGMIPSSVRNNDAEVHHSAMADVFADAEDACATLNNAIQHATFLQRLKSRVFEPTIDTDLSSATTQFVVALASLAGVDSVPTEPLEIQKLIINIYAAFVTPADILNAANVDDLQELDYNA